MESNYSVDGKQLRERRFHLTPADPVPTPHDAARSALDAMPDADREILVDWVAAAIVPAAPRPAYDHPGGKDPASGRITTDTLINHCATDTGLTPTRLQMNGALLHGGYRPTISTSRAAVWIVGAVYVG